MNYTPPVATAADFTWEGESSTYSPSANLSWVIPGDYIPPNGSAVNASWVGTSEYTPVELPLNVSWADFIYYIRPTYNAADATWQGAIPYTRSSYNAADATFQTSEEQPYTWENVSEVWTFGTTNLINVLYSTGLAVSSEYSTIWDTSLTTTSSNLISVLYSTGLAVSSEYSTIWDTFLTATSSTSEYVPPGSTDVDFSWVGATTYTPSTDLSWSNAEYSPPLYSVVNASWVGTMGYVPPGVPLNASWVSGSYNRLSSSTANATWEGQSTYTRPVYNNANAQLGV